MRILIAGFLAFTAWGVFSAWIYNDKLLPVLNAPDETVTVPEQAPAAGSLGTTDADTPEKLSIYFEFNEWKFENDQETDSRIAELKQWLEKHSEAVLSVSGHTDAVGEEDYNRDLGMKRAAAVGSYIESLGIPAEKMIIESKGESEPAADYLTDEGRAKNRRTEVIIKMQ